MTFERVLREVKAKYVLGLKQSPAPSLPFEHDSVRILGQGIGRDSVRHDGPQREQFGPHQKLIANDDSWHVFSLMLDLPIFL